MLGIYRMLLNSINPQYCVAPFTDDGDEIVFNWHFPRGTFEKRMSAYELAQFILPHMPNVLPFLAGCKRVHDHFLAIMTLLATSPREALDEIMPWIKSVTRTEEDDVIRFGIHFKEPEEAPRKIYI